jgi:hypothetical protein
MEDFLFKTRVHRVAVLNFHSVNVIMTRKKKKDGGGEARASFSRRTTAFRDYYTQRGDIS